MEGVFNWILMLWAVIGIAGFIIIKNHAVPKYRMILNIVWGAITLPVFIIQGFHWVNSHPMGTLITVTIISIGGMQFIVSLLFGRGGISDALAGISRYVIAATAVVVMTTTLPYLVSTGGKSINNLLNGGKQVVNTDNTPSKKGGLWDKIKKPFMSSFIKGDVDGFEVFLAKELTKDLNESQKIILQDRLNDLAKLLSEDEDDRRIEKVYIGGHIKKIGGKDSYAIVTADGKCHDLEEPYLVFPDRGITVSSHRGLGTVIPARLNLSITSQGGLVIENENFHCTVSPYGVMERWEVNWN